MPHEQSSMKVPAFCTRSTRCLQILRSQNFAQLRGLTDAFALATSCLRIKPAHNFLGVFPELPSLARKPWAIIKANGTSTVNEHVTLNF